MHVMLTKTSFQAQKLEANGTYIKFTKHLEYSYGFIAGSQSKETILSGSSVLPAVKLEASSRIMSENLGILEEQLKNTIDTYVSYINVDTGATVSSCC